MNNVEHHPDPLDIATDIAQMARDNQVAQIQAKIKPIPTSKVCLNCGEATNDGARWCNKSCASDWQAWNPEA